MNFEIRLFSTVRFMEMINAGSIDDMLLKMETFTIFMKPLLDMTICTVMSTTSKSESFDENDFFRLENPDRGLYFIVECMT